MTAAGVALTAGESFHQVATFKVQATTPVTMPPGTQTCGGFGERATTDANGIQTTDPLCTAVATGAAAGGQNEFFPAVDANIQITPNGTNRVGATHTFTAHVNTNDGSGVGQPQNAPAGTLITFSNVNTFGANAALVPPSCTTVGTTGSCTTTITSTTTGVSTVTASTTVLGVTRSTNGVAPNSGPAVKTWVNAKIAIAPDATNEIGQPHTFTVTLSKDLGDGAGFVPFSGADVDFSLADSNGAGFVLNAAASTCDNAGANTDLNGQCTIVFTSPTPGKVTGNASWTGTLGTPSAFTVTTNGTGGSSGPAVKTFVDANIQIAPLTAFNPITTNHTLTAHVNINDGSGAFQNAPAGTLITFSLTNLGGATAAFVPPGTNTCNTVLATGSCTIVIRSDTEGSTTIRAITNVTVGGIVLHRETGDGKLGDSIDANKVWDLRVVTEILDATGATVLTVPAGTVVRDKVFVTASGVPVTVGTVTFRRFGTIDCSAPPAPVLEGPLTLAADGTALSSTFTAQSDLSYQAVWTSADGLTTRTGACEPLRVIVQQACSRLLLIDEDSIDNGIRFFEDPIIGQQNIFPETLRVFSDIEVNDQKASYTQRDILQYFDDNVGETIALHTGQTGDEGWFAPNCIPQKWILPSNNSNSCLTPSEVLSSDFQNGIRRFFGPPALVKQSKLDKIPDVRPLRGLGLEGLEGQTVCAVVYDSDISINYDHGTRLGVNGNLQGATLGIVAFTVLTDGVNKMNFFSSSTLPEAQIRIEDPTLKCGCFSLYDAPIPRSSSLPRDIDPDSTDDDDDDEPYCTVAEPCP